MRCTCGTKFDCLVLGLLQDARWETLKSLQIGSRLEGRGDTNTRGSQSGMQLAKELTMKKSSRCRWKSLAHGQFGNSLGLPSVSTILPCASALSMS